MAGLLAALKPLCPLSKSSLRIAGFWRASERLKPGFKISLVASTLAAVLVGKTALSTAERSDVVAAGLDSSFTSTTSAFFATDVSDTVPLSELERSSRPILADLSFASSTFSAGLVAASVLTGVVSTG